MSKLFSVTENTVSKSLAMYMILSNTYGKPNKTDMIMFVRTFENILKNNKFKVDNKDYFERVWLQVQQDAPDKAYKNGGFEWYKAVATLDLSGLSTNDIVNKLNEIIIVPEEVNVSVKESKETPNEKKLALGDKEIDKTVIEANYINSLINGAIVAKEQDKTLKKVPEAIHSEKSDKASTSEKSETATTADSLSEQGVQQTELISQSVYDKNRKAEQEKAENERQSLLYTPEDLGVYAPIELAYNKMKYEKIKNMLLKNRVVYINGESQSGKTFISQKLVGELCNVDGNLLEKRLHKGENVLWVNSKITTEEFIGTEDKNGVFPRFCEYNKDSDFCLLVINEAEKPEVQRLLDSIWEKMNRGGVKYKDNVKQGLYIEIPTGIKVKIPQSLCILTNIATCQYDSQMKSRFGHPIDLDEFEMNDAEELSIYTGVPLEIISKILEIQLKVTEQGIERFIVPYRLKNEADTELLEYAKKCLFIYGDKWKQYKSDIENYAMDL